jgi:hypothetical protein
VKTDIARFLASAALLILSGVCPSLAQDPDDLQQGIKAYGTYEGGDIDSVSMTNGNLAVNIPLISYPQRGKQHLGYKLIYNNKNYKQRTMCIAGVCDTYVDIRSPYPPLKAVFDRDYSVQSTFIQETGLTVGFNSYSLLSTDGSSHQLACLSLTGSICEAVDGTGLQGNYSNQNNFDADGSKFGASQEDSDGNIVATADTVGRTITGAPASSTASNGPGACPSGHLPVYANTPWSVPGPNSGTSNFLWCWAQVNIVTEFDIGNSTETTQNRNYPQAIVLPNGTSWADQYSTDG